MANSYTGVQYLISMTWRTSQSANSQELLSTVVKTSVQARHPRRHWTTCGNVLRGDVSIRTTHISV